MVTTLLEIDILINFPALKSTLKLKSMSMYKFLKAVMVKWKEGNNEQKLVLPIKKVMMKSFLQL